MNEEREFTSAKYLARAITELGFKKSPKSVMPYINIMKELEIIESSGDSQKPYTIIKTKQEMREILETYSWAIESKNKFYPNYNLNLHNRSVDRGNASDGI